MQNTLLSNLLKKQKHPQVLLLTVLTLVSQVLWQATAGWLVASTDQARASIQAVVLTSVAIAVWPCEAFRTPASWQP